MLAADPRYVTPVSSDLLASAFEATTVGMLIVDGEGKITVVNGSALDMFGYSKEEMLGRSIESLVPSRMRGAHASYRAAFLRAPAERAMGAGRDLYALRKDGTEFPVEIGLRPIGAPQLGLVLSTVVDITERRRLQDRFRMVVENAPNAIVMVNTSGKLVLVNGQAERVFGYGRGEMLGLSIDTLVPERFRAHHPAFRNAFFAQPDARPMGAGRDLYARRRDGSEFPVEIGLVPLDTEDGPMVLSAIVDITERKQREESIKSALREKEVLLGEVHHRVKNNLQVIESLLSLQARRVKHPEVQSALQDSQNRIRSLSYIHQTLYQSGDFAFVDFHAFLRELLPRLVDSTAIDASAVRVSFDAGDVQLPINLAIPCGLIVNELVTNALKHGFPSGTRGMISVELAHDAPETIAMTVENDGLLIAEDVSLTGGGTLGVQLVTLLTEQLQGRFEVERRPRTRFRVRFPCK